MARPAKRTCDYFSHFAGDSKDLYFIETRYGVEGYYFYYRLREFLCQCDDITCRIEYEADLEYLYRYFALDKAKVQDMIDACADNGIIDHNLWYNAKIIWQDDLAAILKDAWKGRKTPPPEKPIVEIENKLRVSNAINPVSSHINPVSNPINTQIKGNETKLNKNKKNKNKINEIRLEDSNDRSVSSIAPFEEGQKETELEGDDFSSYLKNIAKNLKSPTKKY